MEWLYIIAAALFVLGLKMLSSPLTARRGNVVSAVGMLLAIVATLSRGGLSFTWIAAGIVIGSAIGAVSAYRVKMTAMPEMVAIFNGFGGLASLLVGWAEYHMHRDAPTFTIVAIYLAVLIGGVTFTGSVLAFAKLAELVTGKPVTFRGQHIVNGLLLAAVVLFGVIFTLAPESSYTILILGVVLALVIGVFVVLPIGGADMPVVICLLNSYSGLAAAAAGFVLANNMLIVAGSLVGASGIILTQIMCKAMNRSLANVLFSGFGAAAGTVTGAGAKGEAKSTSPHDAYFALEAANSVVFVPGYGMAVAQAQHVVKELADLLEANGTDVKYAIHPVAGRMPGHMNVLLAEADVPYDQLMEMDAINPLMPTIDVALVIGANDVVNPAAHEDKSSPIYGMPIINVDQARTVFVLKRSMASGFAGIENPLFFKGNTTMIFGDAKKTLQEIVSEFKAA
jgi:NAD(P) transhydrogenase subunit beta